jgi:hypothetical protein
VRERLVISRQAAQKMEIGRLNVKKLNEAEIREQYQVTIRNKYAAV